LGHCVKSANYRRGDGQLNIQGRDCSIVIKTTHVEKDIPYSEETIREAASLLIEEPPIEGDGICRAIKRSGGVTGCIVTPLTIGTAPLLLCLAMGDASLPVYVSGTKNLYKYRLDLIPTEETDQFGLIQDCGGYRRYYPVARVKSYELRFERDNAIKLKLDIYGERAPVIYPYVDTFDRERGERFKGENVVYTINGKEYKNIYGLTLLVKKDGGTKTEVWIKRALEKENDIPENIVELTITAKLLRDRYEERCVGEFRITMRRLFLCSDETTINCDDSIIGPLRYYVAGIVTAEVFTSGTGAIL